MVGRPALTRLGGVLAISTVAACASSPDDEFGQTSSPLTAYCDAVVKGVGTISTEDQYLANVVHCENGGAPF